MSTILILDGTIVNEGHSFNADIFIKNGRIERIDKSLSSYTADHIIDAKGLHIFPGVIDDQVHFREPGLTHKANIATESHAAVRGGITSFMEMPNTSPPALSQELLEEKFAIAKKVSPANYSFYMGLSNENAETVLRTDKQRVCGIKAFLGSSTGNLLVDDAKTLERVCAESPMLLATHCEDEHTVKSNEALFFEKHGEDMPIEYHEYIRSEDACYKSSQWIIGIAKTHQSRLHILHISTEKETHLIGKAKAENPNLSAEVCVHHLWFDSSDYANYGTKIKCNPAIKNQSHKKALWEALKNDIFDLIATDHAPHTLEEKNQSYWKAPSGIPLIQHSLLLMLEHYHKGKISLPSIVEKMCHQPARIFKILERGFLREGCWADIAIADLQLATPHLIKDLYKCAWSPFSNYKFSSDVLYTITSGEMAYAKGKFGNPKGQRLEFVV